jgi:hypothetical protein
LAYTASGYRCPGLQGCEDFGGVPFRLHILEYLANATIRPDQERRAGDAHDHLAVHVFLLQRAVLLRDGFVLVAKEREGQAFLFLELCLGFGRIRGDAEYDRVLLLEITDGPAKLAGFDGSARCVGLGIEVENHVFSLKSR